MPKPTPHRDPVLESPMLVCTCHAHALRLYTDAGLQMTFIEYWEQAPSGLQSLRDKLHMAWDLLRWGRVELGDVALNPEGLAQLRDQAEEHRQFLLENIPPA